MKARLAALGLALAATASALCAQSWTPSRNVEFVVGAGGGNDRTARTIQRLLRVFLIWVALRRRPAGPANKQKHAAEPTKLPHCGSPFLH